MFLLDLKSINNAVWGEQQQHPKICTTVEPPWVEAPSARVQKKPTLLSAQGKQNPNGTNFHFQDGAASHQK